MFEGREKLPERAFAAALANRDFQLLSQERG
jgi:hypothetical protein